MAIEMFTIDISEDSFVSAEKIPINERNESIKQQKRKLIHQLSFLLDEDPMSHFFYEPELIFRCSSSIFKKVTHYLEALPIRFVSYEYPISCDPSIQNACNENADGIVMHHLEMFLHIFHQHAIAAKVLTPKEHLLYINKIIEGLFSGKTVKNAGEMIGWLGGTKLDRPVVYHKQPTTNTADACLLAFSHPEIESYSNSTPDTNKSILDNSVVLFEKYSEAVSNMSDVEQMSYMERVIHTMFNMAGYSRREEGEYLTLLAAELLGEFVYYKEPATEQPSFFSSKLKKVSVNRTATINQDEVTQHCPQCTFL